MPKLDKRGLLLGICWSSGLGVVIALLSLIATGGAIPRWAVMALGGIGFISFSIVAIGHGWLKAPSWLGVPIRVFFRNRRYWQHDVLPLLDGVATHSRSAKRQ